MSESKRILIKAILLGDPWVGKTSLINQFVNRKFSNQYKTTIGVDFSTREVVVGDKTIMLQLWDTAGLERFHTLGPAFYRGADCCVLVYDTTSTSSFNDLDKWRSEFLLHANIREPETFPFLVIGNKIDLPSRMVSRKQAEQWCKSRHNALYFETSAKEATNVSEAFQNLARIGIKREDDWLINSSMNETVNLKRQSVSSWGCSC